MACPCRGRPRRRRCQGEVPCSRLLAPLSILVARARAELGPFAPVLLVAGKFPGAGRRRCPGHFPDLFQVSNRRWQNPGGAARTASRASAISLRALGFGGSRVVHPVQDAVVRKRVMLVVTKGLWRHRVIPPVEEVLHCVVNLLLTKKSLDPFHIFTGTSMQDASGVRSECVLRGTTAPFCI